MQTASENIRSAYKVYMWYMILFKNENPDSKIQTENPASKIKMIYTANHLRK